MQGSMFYYEKMYQFTQILISVIEDFQIIWGPAIVLLMIYVVYGAIFGAATGGGASSEDTDE